ncbi:D-glycerate dehydrogenase [Candidatus Woesearchaeota archaeon]|nr:D-glycerate dehydrogenase [Candidatus Woesearchaeota archaeon]
MPRPKVFITRKIPNAGVVLLKKSCDVRIYPRDQAISRQDLLKGVRWCDALLPLLTEKIDKEVLNVNPNLKIVANYAVGFDNIDVKSATSRGIPVTNTPGVLEDAVAEHTFALLFAITKHLVEADHFTRTGKYKSWEPLLFLGPQLKSKVLGIVGLGRIGSSVAQKAVAMGMHVIYTDVQRNLPFEKKFHARFVSKEMLLKTADFVSLHVPLLPATRHLIGAKELRLMKRTAYLINTSRGSVVDEKALVHALKTKMIAGAALDVYEFEPNLSPGLNKLSNVVLTPHTASATWEARQAMSEIAAKNILAVLTGKKAPNIVNPEVYQTR